MDVKWVCRLCGKQLAKITAENYYPYVTELTAQAGDGIISMDGDGSLTVRLLCDECQDMADWQEDSIIDFVRGPQIH